MFDRMQQNKKSLVCGTMKDKSDK